MQYVKNLYNKNILPHIDELINKKIVPNISDYLSRKLPRSAQDIHDMAAYTELPTHVLKAIGKNFYGSEGKRNLREGILTGSGLSGLSLGADYLNKRRDNGTLDIHKGRATASGLLGVLTPLLLRSSRAGPQAIRNFKLLVQGLKDHGMLSANPETLATRLNILKKLHGQDMDSVVKDLIHNTGDARSMLGTLLTPDKEMYVTFLRNAEGKLPQDLIRMGASQFGKTTLNAGTVINPNIARVLNSLKAQVKFKKMGLREIIGEKGDIAKTGPELHAILNKRYKDIFTKIKPEEYNKVLAGRKFEDLSAEELKKLLPDEDINMFPFTAAVPNSNSSVNFAPYTNNVAPRPSFYREDYSNFRPRNTSYAQYDAHDEIAKKWLASQGVTSSEHYNSLLNTINTFASYNAHTAKNNPKAYLSDAYKLPGINTYFVPGTEAPFRTVL